MGLRSHLAASLVALALLSVPNVDRDDCSNVDGRYSTAVAKLASAVHAYEKCVVTSNQRDDCAAEIQALDDAHDDFADAVADAKDCQ